MLPLPVSVKAPNVGTVTATLMGLFVVKLPGVFATTSVPDRTWVVTRSSRLSSPLTTTDCFSPTRITTLLAPASSTPVNVPTCRACAAGTPDPVSVVFDEPPNTSN